MKTILVTGFAPFGGANVNPSWEAVKALPEHIGDFCLVKLELPVVFGEAARIAVARAEAEGADAVLCLGQAAGRAEVTPEYVGINLRSGEKSDNAGNCFREAPIVPEGPAAYFSTLPVMAMTEAIAGAGISAQVSYSAGTYVCNDVFYGLLHHFRNSQVRVGFIHVPLLPEQTRAGEPSLPLETDIRALTIAIEQL